MGLALGPAKTCFSMKRCGAAVVLGGDYKSPAPSVCSIERGSNGGLGPFEWAQSGKPRVPAPFYLTTKLFDLRVTQLFPKTEVLGKSCTRNTQSKSRRTTKRVLNRCLYWVVVN